MLEGPADERIGGIREGFGRYVCVRIEPVQAAHARKRDVSEDIL
jgi:hypothetical protein